jgi:hypothetical protein
MNLQHAITGNAQLAGQLRAEADAVVRRRRVLLTASVALAETKNTAAAIKVLQEWDGPADTKAAAIGLIEQLTSGRGPEDPL